MGKRLLSFFSAFIMAASLFAFGDMKTARAADPKLSDITEWTVAYPQNDQNDKLHDQQTGSGSVSQDIVGNETYPSTYMCFTSTDISFRIRLNNIDGEGPYSFKNFAFVGVDADCSGSVDFFLGVYNPVGNNGRVGIYSAAAGYANTSPSTTGISGKPLLAYQPVSDVNYLITKVDDGSKIDGNDDYFISFKFSLADIAAATGRTFTATTPFRFMTGTAAQDNSFNQDLNGMDETGWSSGSTWNQLGVFSNVVTASGSVAYSTVTFNKNTGDTDSIPLTKAVQTGSALGSLPGTPPTKRGMYFQEWNTAPDGSGSKVTTSTIISGNTTFYAIWSSSDVYTVTFDPAGGILYGLASSTTVPTINGVVGDNMPPDPTYSKTFEGWKNLTTGEFFNAVTQVTSNITVTAQWAANNNANNVACFFDNFDASGGTEIARVYSRGNSTNFNGSLPTITRPGYTFGGWFWNDKTCSDTAAASIDKAGNYYAKWTIASYTVTFKENYSGCPADTNRSVSGGVLGTLPSPTRTNYTFVEWNRSAAGTGEPMYATSVITSDTNLYAIWAYVQTVTFHANGGDFELDEVTHPITWSTTALNGTLAKQPQPPVLAGNTFLGWGTADNSTTPVSLLDVSAHNDYYAIWSPVKTVTFNENHGDTPAESTVLTAYGSVLYIPQDPAWTSHTFEGWNTQDDGLGTAFTLSTAVENDIKVYAQWQLAGTPYTVSFVTNGGSSLADVTTTEIVSEPVSTLTGYTLKGWYTDSGRTNKVTFPYAVTANQTLYADWTPNTYTVNYNSNGGDGGSTASSSHTYDAAKALTANGFTKQYYTFAGWAETSGGSVKYANSESVTNLTAYAGTVTLYAKWTPNTYTVVYNGNGSDGGTTASSSHTCDASKALTTNGFTLTGHSFAGWALTENDTAQYADGESVMNLTDVNGGIVNLFATWNVVSPTTYHVSFVTNGGSSVADQTTDVIHNKPVSLKDGYALKGWYKDAGLTEKVDFPYTLTEDTTLYADWTPGTYIVVYNGNGSDGGATASSSHTYDAAKALTANGFTRQYYTFAGWSETSGGSIKYANSESVKNLTTTDGATITLYAKWLPNTYSVVYNGNGSDGGSTATSNHVCGVAKALTTNGFTRTGYSFAGWALATDGDVKYANGESVMNLTAVNGGTVTLFAKWSPQPILKSSEPDATIAEDGRITLTPTVPGGTWDYDPTYLKFDGNTFTALKPGTTVVTYTVGGVTVRYEITIKVSKLPSTGQDFTLVYILTAAALLAVGCLIVMRRKISVNKR